MQNVIKCFFGALCALTVVDCSNVFTLHASQSLSLMPCKVAEAPSSARCGKLMVPEDRSKAFGRMISLNVMILPAVGRRNLPSLYSLEGGPGIAATGAVGFWALAGSIHRQHRDIVLIDQRGTGNSAPLNCALNFNDPLIPVLEVSEVRQCRARLAANADLSAYSTAAAVEDIDAMRIALDQDKIDLMGLSYGTRLAQEYLRAHPEHVRAVALLGTLSPVEKLPLSSSTGAEIVLRRLVQECADDLECHTAIPELAADISALSGQFHSGVLTATYAHRTVTLNAGPFWEAVRGQLLTTTTQRRLPWLLHQASQGRFDALLAKTTGRLDDGANGLLLSVLCPEDTLRIDDEDLAKLPSTLFGSYRARQQLNACKAWGLSPPQQPRGAYVDARLPALLMAGEMDAVTPISWARDVAAHLPKSRVVAIPELGHFPDGLSHMECYDRIIAQFFELGSADALDIGCVQSMQPPPFQLGS